MSSLTTRKFAVGGDFDYGEYESLTRAPYLIKDVLYFSVISVIFILGILGTFIVLVLMIAKKGRHFRGVRWYCFNLMLANILYLVSFTPPPPRMGEFEQF